MIFFDVDEGGDPTLDRALFQLERACFSREMQGFTARNPDMRPEHYEIKGRQPVKPSHAGSFDAREKLTSYARQE